MAKQTRKVSRRAAAKPKTNGSTTNGVIKLTTQQNDPLRVIDQRIAALKQSLGDAELQANQIAQRKQQIISAIATAQTELNTAAQALIAPYKKSDDEVWSVDMNAMTLTKRPSA